MFYISGSTIYLTKGDDAELTVSVTLNDGTAYTMKSADTLTLTVRKLPSVAEDELLKATSTGSNSILITHDLSQNMTVGQYSADIQLTIAETGRIYTIWPRLSGSAAYSETNFKNFVIMPEVSD